MAAKELYTTTLFSDADLQFYGRLESDFTDLSPNGYSLTPNNTPTFGAEKFGNGARLVSASSQYANRAAGTFANLIRSGSQTWMFWLKLTTNTAAMEPFSIYDGSSGLIRCQLNSGANGRLQFQALGLTTNTIVTHASTLSTGTMYHIACVYDSSASKLRVYLNGVVTEVTASGSINTPTGSAQFDIGRLAVSGVEYLNGSIDDFAMFSRVLSGSEIYDYYVGTTPVVGASSLLTGCKAYWKLDEASGTRVDSHSTNDLTDNATVTQATGKISDAAQFTAANSEYLSLADNAALSVGDIDFTFACWVYLDSVGFRTVLSKESSSGTREYILWYDSTGAVATNRFHWQVQDAAANSGGVTANNFGAASTGTWYFIVCWHDSVNNQVGISVNNGTPDTASYSNGSFDSGTDFNIGREANGSRYWDGRIDEVGFWKRVLTAAERTYLYGGGAGLAFPLTLPTAQARFLPLL